MSFSAKRSPYSGMPSFSRKSPISCTAAHSPAHLAMLRWNIIRTEGAGLFRRRRSATGNGRAGSLFPPAADRRWYCVEISLSGRPGRPARAAHAPGPTAVSGKPSAPKPRQRPPRARHRAVNSTLTRRPCPATDGAAAKSPPVRSRSRLLVVDSPRLVITITGWGPGR